MTRPPREADVVAAERLKVALTTKLAAAKGNMVLTEGLFKGLKLVDKYLGTGGGGDLSQLKSQVQAAITSGVRKPSGTTAKAQTARAATFAQCETSSKPSSAPKAAAGGGFGGSTFGGGKAAAEAARPEMWTLPPLVVERLGRQNLNEYGKMALEEHVRVKKEDAAKKAKLRERQAFMKRELEQQMREHEAERLAERREMQLEAERQAQELAAYKEQEELKAFRLQSKIAEEKEQRRIQVNEQRERMAAEAEAAKLEDRRMMQAQMAENQRLNEQKRQMVLDNRIMLRRVQEQNIKDIEAKLLEKEAEKLREIALAREYEAVQEAKERQRLAALDEIQEKQRKMYLAGGGEAMAASMAERAAEDERRAEQQQAQRDAQEQLKAERKAQKLKDDAAAIRASLDTQIAERRAGREQEKRAKLALARELQRNVEEDERKAKAAKQASNKRKQELRHNLTNQMQLDAQRRYAQAAQGDA
mmetsp:Transcript_19884/g.64707  ORF Transcript_19884/g.64707 Transcript_19884/m.64707 type:complete len:475 (+) Transcript_19884:77-1501(+)